MSSQKQYKTWSPGQPFLLPPSPLDWLPEGHLAYFLLDVVEQLDLSMIEARYQRKDARGTRPYAPSMMVALIFYGYCTGVFSSREIERATYEDIAFRVIAGGHHPHFTRVNAFRKDFLNELSELFLQVLRLCQTAGLVKLGHVALDGTKVQANASKHKAMSYERMLKAEAQLREEIAALMSQAEQADVDDDARLGEGVAAQDIPAELHRREERLATILKAKESLEAEAAAARARVLREQAQRAEVQAQTEEDPVERKRSATRAERLKAQAQQLAPGKDDDDIDPPTTSDGLPLHEPKTTRDGLPKANAQMNFTDPDSRIMESGGTFVQGFNCQAVVDSHRQIIVAQALSNQSPDNGCLVPMLALTISNCGVTPTVLTADAGYWQPEIPVTPAKDSTDIFVSTRRRKHGPEDPTENEPAPAQPKETPREQMRAKLETAEGKATYARRKAIVEPVFGQIKEVRGFRRFLLRGLEKAQGEWSLQCTAHNLLKLWRAEGLVPAM